jgi:carbonic anhydrase
LSSEEDRINRMCELNVIEQVKSVSHTTIVQDAWRRGQELSVHGWIYGLQDGLVNDLGVRIAQLGQVATPYRFSEKRRDVVESSAKAGKGWNRERRGNKKS